MAGIGSASSGIVSSTDLDIRNLDSSTDSISVPGASTSAKQDTLLTELQLKADLTETQPVSIATMPTTPVTGTFFQATQPVSIATMPSTPVTGTFYQATQPVSLASVPSHAVTNAGTFAVQVTSAPTTAVTGTFWQTTQPVSVATIPSHAVTNAGTFATQATLQTGTNAIGKVGHDITGTGHGVTTVTTAGTDVALAGSTACKKVIVQSQTDNTNLIAVGATGVDATIATGTGIVLYPGDSVEIEIDNLADLFIDSLVSGEGVRYQYFT